MRFLPNRGRVFVKLDPIEEFVTKGGIIVHSKHSEMSRIGTVIEVADDVKNFKPGDRIFINFFSGSGIDFIDTDCKHDTHRFLSEVEILGKVVEE